MKLTLDYLSKSSNRRNVRVSDLGALLRSKGFTFTGEDSRSGQKWKHANGRTVSFTSPSGQADVGGVRDVYEACLEIENQGTSQVGQKHPQWKSLPLPAALNKKFQAFRLDDKFVIRYADFPEFSKEFENNPQAGSLPRQLHLQADKLEAKYELACKNAVDLERKYHFAIIRHDEKTLTLKQDDLDIEIHCSANGTSLGDHVATAIKTASIMAKTAAETRQEKLLLLEDKHGFKLDFTQTEIILTHPEAAQSWNLKINYQADGELLTKAGYEALLELEKGNFPKAQDPVLAATALEAGQHIADIVENTNVVAAFAQSGGVCDTHQTVETSTELAPGQITEHDSLQTHTEDLSADGLSGLKTVPVEDLSTDVVIEEKKNTHELFPIPAKKSLQNVSLVEFQQDPKAHMHAAQGGAPKAVKDADGKTLAIIMPLDRHPELAQVMGSKMAVWESCKTIPKYRCAVLANSKHAFSFRQSFQEAKPIGFMLPGHYEEDVAAETSGQHLVIENMPDAHIFGPQFAADAASQSSSLDGGREQQNVGEPRPGRPIEYAYKIGNVARIRSKVAEFRQELADGKIIIVAKPEKIIAVYVPETLLDKLLPEGGEWTAISPNRHQDLLESGQFKQGDFEEFFKIQPQASSFKEKIEYAGKNPYGFISWNSALSLVEAGVLPAIPQDIKNEVEEVCKHMEKIASGKKQVADKPAQVGQTSPAKANLSPVPAAPQGDAIAVGEIQNVDLKSLNIQDRLAAIKAQKQLTETFSIVHDSLKNQNGFLPVTLGNRKVYATASEDFTASARDIAAAFELECASVEIDPVGNDLLSKWMRAFRAAAGSEKTLTFVKDKSLGKDVVIVPANDPMREILSQLGIDLE